MMTQGGDRSKRKRKVGRPKKKDETKPKTRSMDRADRQRAKKSRNKLSQKQIDWIFSQKGTGKSTRQVAKEYKKKYHNIHRISHQMVWKMWNGQCHNPDAVKEEKPAAKAKGDISIYDLIDNAKSLGDEALDDLLDEISNKKIRY
jgi:fido (protein-threonine AMPylation protein)